MDFCRTLKTGGGEHKATWHNTMPDWLCDDCDDPPDNDNDQDHHTSTGRERKGKLAHCSRK